MGLSDSDIPPRKGTAVPRWPLPVGSWGAGGKQNGGTVSRFVAEVMAMAEEAGLPFDTCCSILETRCSS